MHRFVSVLSTTILVSLLLCGWTTQRAGAQETEDIQTAEYDVNELDYPDLPDFEVPEPRRVELDNGMVVFLLEDHELPTINASARINAGSVYEPAKKRGLASVTGQVMRTGGTESMSSDSLNVVLENRGASIETGFGETSGSASMSSLAEDVDTVLPIFADVVRSPAFAEGKVQEAKSQQQSVISRRNENPQQIGFREFDKILYGENSPYARTPEMYTVERIERADLVDFHEDYVQPNNVILSVWGDFDPEHMTKRIRAQFGDWSAPEDYEPPAPPEPEAEREYSVNFIQKSDVTQSTVFLGHAGEITRRSGDYASVTIMNEVLSGGFSGRLFQNVRREKGLAYSVFGNYSAPYDRPGRFFAGVFSKSPSTVEATEAVIHEVERMQEQAPSQEELSLAKDSYLNSFVFNFDTEEEILNRLMNYEYYDYPADFLQQTREAIEDVTPDDVLSVSQKYLYPQESHIVVVGNRDDFSEDVSNLTKGGTVNEIDITIPREPPSEEQAPLTAEEEKARAVGREIMGRVKEALGGTAFDQIEAMRIVTEEEGNETTLTVRLPDQLRTEVSTPMGSITVVDDGSTMTMDTPQGTQTAPAQVRDQIKGSLWRSLPYLMTNLNRDGLSFQDAGEETLEGTTYQLVKVEPPQGTSYTLHVPPETHRPVRMTFEQTNPQTGGTVAVEATMSDYQETNGVLIPYTTEQVQSTSQGEQTSTSTVQSVVINPDLGSNPFSLESSE